MWYYIIYSTQMLSSRMRGTLKRQLVVSTEAVVHIRGDCLQSGLHQPSYCTAHLMCWDLGTWQSCDVNCIVHWFGDESDYVIVIT